MTFEDIKHQLIIIITIIEGAGIAQWLERRTRDWKVAGSNPCWNGGRIFFSRVDFLCWLLFRYPFHPRVTTVARKISRSFCQKCRWQVTAKHAYTLRMWLLLNRASALLTTCPEYVKWHLRTLSINSSSSSPLSGFQARSKDLRGGRWSWTLTFAQKRSWVGRWSWAEQVGRLLLRVVQVVRQQRCNGHCLSDSVQHSSWKSNCAVHKSLGNGEGTPP